METIPLEDYYEDIIGKAQRGLGLDDFSLASKAGVTTSDVADAKRGRFDQGIAEKLACALKLSPTALAACGQKSWSPDRVLVDGLTQFNTPYHDMRVNAYLAWSPESKDAAIFDTGTDANAMIRLAREADLAVRSIFLTHTHPDHIADLDAVRAAFPGVPTYVHASEMIAGAMPVAGGDPFEIGPLRIEARHTWGHSVGGITYVVRGLVRPIAIVGDAVFAGSMGGGVISYADALRTNREEILSLPGETILCPGHGPMTTVAEEAAHNPFFAEVS